MCHLAHHLKIRNGLIVFREEHPDEATPLVNRQEPAASRAGVIRSLTSMALCIKRDRFVVSIGLAGLVS